MYAVLVCPGRSLQTASNSVTPTMTHSSSITATNVRSPELCCCLTVYLRCCLALLLFIVPAPSWRAQSPRAPTLADGLRLADQQLQQDEHGFRKRYLQLEQHADAGEQVVLLPADSGAACSCPFRLTESAAERSPRLLAMSQPPSVQTPSSTGTSSGTASSSGSISLSATITGTASSVRHHDARLASRYRRRAASNHAPSCCPCIRPTIMPPFLL